ncbi:major facilitator superfamily domain-containing protein [Aspergillus caelatus]|uniref:Major facilitator superfamily domain-containing protein n=2 Tax=Aspergillus subgen. Circumdati TaxID=2720871 RepID=A0A5N7AH71_9EURO|nr:major facilitator superfamily domain-containing protein [Aspergillus caelatus]KAE8367990.1 major facilitator superfamily domain-containing protein [Aspergillus caelatus]KAE8413760.1 major facilitator superfamily domain-containing protein [Aspergillus pseudocaelatus]
MEGKDTEKAPQVHCKEPSIPSPTESSQTFDLECEYHDPKLPPVDGGIHAWLFLAACFVVEGTVWGFAACFGVFQNYYRNDPAFQGSHAIAAIGTCAMGMAYLLSPIVMAILIALPRLQRWASSIAFVVLSLSLALSSFSTSVTHLILSQGIAYGTAGCFAYAPSILFMPDWFVKKKSLAFGIVWSGSGLTGIIFPLILQSLLDTYGWQTTLRICSVAIFLLAAPFMLFHKPRVPRRTTNLHQLDLSFHRNRTYLIYQAGNIIQSLGFFLPQIFLPSYAGLLGAKGLEASSTITVFNISNMFGCILIGWLADRYHVTKCILISTVGAIFSTFLLWGMSVHLAPLYLFSIVYGCTGGSFSSSWAATSSEVGKSHPSADVSMVFAFMETGRGIGNVISGPLSEALLKTRLWEGQAWGAYGTEYGILVVLTGVTGLLGGVSVVARALRWI